MTSQEMVDQLMWGFQHTSWSAKSDSVFRAPLPVLAAHPNHERSFEPSSFGLWAWVKMPPYICAAVESDGLHVDLWEADGWRASENPSDATDQRRWIYADGENVPEEWKQPIADALVLVKEHWPGQEPLFRPPPELRRGP